MTAEETMYQEAVAAVERGERSRARDLLSRLLKADQNNAGYWLWMSAVVDTQKERAYCLKECLRVDPNNIDAQRGLAMMGMLDLNPAYKLPLSAQKTGWDKKVLTPEERKATGKAISQTVLFAAIAVVAVALLLVGIFGLPRWLRATRTVQILPTITLLPTSAEQTLVVTGVPGQPTPLAVLLGVSYTPTPLVVQTPHPQLEAYTAAMRSYEKGDWQGVISFMQQVLQSEPQSADAYYYIGEALRFSGDYRNAIDSYTEALRIDINFAPAFLGRARARIAEYPDRITEPLADLTAAIQIDPNFMEAYLEMARLQLTDAEPRHALEYLNMAEDLRPDSPMVYYTEADAYLALGDLESALEAAQKALELDPTSLPSYRQVASLYMQLDESAQAIEPLRTYTTYITEDAGAYGMLGAALAEANDLEGALDALTKSLALNPDQPQYLIERGWVYVRQEQGRLALTDFDNALRFNKDSFPAQFGRGRALYAFDAIGDAYVQFNVAEGYVETDADMAQLLYWRAQALEELGQNDAAQRDWEALMALPADVLENGWTAEALVHIETLSGRTMTPTATVTKTPTPKPTETLPGSVRTLTATYARTGTPARTPTSTPTPKP